MAKRSRKKTFTLQNLLLVLLIALLYAAYYYVTERQKPVPGTAVDTTPVPVTSVPQTAIAGTTNTGLPWLTVYFTDPSTTNENKLDAANYLYQYVLPIINSAQKTIDVASFDLNLPVIVNALVDAAKRGVIVRVIVDEENGDLELEPGKVPSNININTVNAFNTANIKFVDGGRSNGLMHNKIIIVDGKTLIMGSWNVSYNDTFRNNNNLLIINNPTLVANYQAKFNEGYVEGRFGAKSTVKSPSPRVSIDGTLVETYFSPEDKVMDKLVALVRTAQKSVKFIAFTYTHKSLAAAMIDRAQNGVKVEGVIENRGASQGALPYLFCSGIPVKTDANKYTMHHKVIVIDESIVVTGSYNFTQSADDSNDDNVLIIHNPGVAGMYIDEFNKIYNAANNVDASDYNCQNVFASATPKPRK